MTASFRPPCVPLIMADPYFSIWSAADRLYDNDTRHWTGKSHSMVGMAKIDGKVWRFMGGHDVRSDFPSVSAPAMMQLSLQVKPLSTVYTFAAGGVRLTVDFTTPLLPDDLDVLSRPASYVTMDVSSVDGEAHQIEIYFDVTAELCVDQPIQEVEPSRLSLADGSSVLRFGTTSQPVLGRSGDDLRIDWGYACLVVPKSADVQTTDAVAGIALRNLYAETGSFAAHDDTRFPRAVLDDKPLLACVMNYGTVGAAVKSHFLVVAYDDLWAVEYFGRRLPGYWKKDGQSAEQMLQRVVTEYGGIVKKCEAFNRSVTADATASGGAQYADILALAYRQAIAAHKLVADENGDVLFFSKENFSNGCMATVDVSYPSIPLFLLYNVELAKGMLRPVFKYAESDAWPFDFAPHDVGRYPLANGQAYGMAMERQMPIEECGNMIIMTAAVCLAEGSADFASRHWVSLTKWHKYLLEFGMDPGNQLCTDDFGGHLAHNANLSVKAIVAIGSYGLLCGMRGDEEAKRSCVETARRMAVQWEQMAREDDHYRLAFDAPGTWSMKYNLVWDTLFGLHLFPEQIRKREVAYYIKKRERYGTPLDSRKTYTKADWLLWAAAMADTREDFETLVQPLWDFLNESVSRVPFTDWYYTIDGRMTGFINRSVVGGLFIKLLADQREALNLTRE